MVQRGEACDDRTELDELKFGERDRQECLSYEAVSFLARRASKVYEGWPACSIDSVSLAMLPIKRSH